MPVERVAADLRKRVQAGEWVHEQALPSVSALAEHYRVTRATISRALKTLSDEGLLLVRPRWGTFRR